MPLLSGWHFVNSRQKSLGVRSPDGRIVSRSQAENAGARWLGYRNEHDYRKGKASRDTYIRNVLDSRQGKADIERARQHAKSRGQRLSAKEYKQTLLALHNAERTGRGDPIDRSPGSPIARFHELRGSSLSRAWETFIAGTDTP